MLFVFVWLKMYRTVSDCKWHLILTNFGFVRCKKWIVDVIVYAGNVGSHEYPIRFNFVMHFLQWWGSISRVISNSLYRNSSTNWVSSCYFLLMQKLKWISLSLWPSQWKPCNWTYMWKQISKQLSKLQFEIKTNTQTLVDKLYTCSKFCFWLL